jgi:hypothetical protein
MSLINEALKRAKQAQQENPPATPALEFRPVEPSQSASRRTTLLIVGMTLVVILILGLAGTLIWFVFKSDRASLPVAARVAEAPLAALPSEVKPAPAPTPAKEALPAVAPATGQKFEHPDEPNTNRVPVVADVVEAIQPPALKLQGIFFSPSHPSAVVNGKTVYLGDRVNGFRLVAVSPVAATFVSATETNVLSLSGQ